MDADSEAAGLPSYLEEASACLDMDNEGLESVHASETNQEEPSDPLLNSPPLEVMAVTEDSSLVAQRGEQPQSDMEDISLVTQQYLQQHPQAMLQVNSSLVGQERQSSHEQRQQQLQQQLTTRPFAVKEEPKSTMEEAIQDNTEKQVIGHPGQEESNQRPGRSDGHQHHVFKVS